MNKQIKAVHFDADVNLINHVEKRLGKLEVFHDRITNVEVFLKIENASHQIKDKVAEIKVSVPQQTFFGQHESKSFEESFDSAFNAIVKQIKRHKSKQLQN